MVRSVAGHGHSGGTSEHLGDPRLTELISLNDESLRIPDTQGQRVVFMSAAPGSESAERLRRLASAANA